MDFASIFNSIISYFTSGKQDADLSASLDLFKTYLNGKKNETIRMWVSDAPGYGHQTNTVNLLYQLTNPADENGFEYSGTIDVYYLEDKNKTTLKKLLELLPSLNGNAQGGKVNYANVNLIEWKNGDPPPLPVVNLGFTGAEDQIDNNGVITSPDLAARLNTSYFLRLEPYLWTTPEEIQFLDSNKKPIDLTKQSLLQYGAFKQRAYWEQIPVPEPDWDYYRDNGFADQVAVLRSLLAKTEDYDLGVVYSIRTKGNYELLYPPEERMFAFITGCMASQMNGTSIRSDAKPIVVLSMDNFTNRTGGGETPIRELMNGQKSAQERSWQTCLDIGGNGIRDYSQRELNQLRQYLKPSEYRAQYLTEVDAANRIDYVWDATQQNVEAKYGWLNGSKKNVLFVQVGRVPAPIFNYLMYKAAMPSVFEGQNTGNLALQFGKPYFHVTRPSSSNVQYPTTLLGYSEYDVYEDYMNIYMPVVYVPTIVYKMQKIANMINFPLEVWPSNPAENPSETIGTFIRNYLSSPTGDYQTYYKTIRTFYQNPANDKFRVGASYFGYILQSNGAIVPPENFRNVPVLTSADDTRNPLNDLLEKLYANLDDNKGLNLFPGVYSAGPIFDFISGLLGVKLYLTEASIDPARGTTDPDQITVTGNSSVLDEVPLAFTIRFTAPEGSVVSDWKLTYTGDWLTGELPWLLFKQPYVSLTVANTLIPAQGSVGGILQGLDLDLSIRLPIQDGVWQLEGHFKEPASVSRFYQLAGGVNLVQSLPSPFNAFSAIGVTDCQLAYNSASKTIEYISFVMATNEPVKLMENLVMDAITFNVLVENPGSITDRSTTWSVMGKFEIGTGDNPGVVVVSMNYPDTVISGQLASGVIKVTDLFNLFLPGTVFNPQGYTPEVTEFMASFEGTTGNYSVVSKLNFDWTFEIIPGAPTVTINNVGVRVQSKNNTFEGGISGGFTFKKENGETAFSISLAANYGSNTGWVFIGQQDEGSLSLTALANQLLPSNWQIPSDYNYALKNLGFTFKETSKYYEINGETDGYWKVPFINLKVRADLKFGYGVYETGNGTASTTRLLMQANRKTDNLTENKVGYYCTLNADIEWIGIKMTLFYDYNPDILTFRFTWGFLTGTIVEKEVQKGQPKHWIGTLKFTESVSLGSMVEEAISWLTGYKYGLAAPWSLLNSLSLSALELTYDFTAKTVSFNLDIGEINLGFCKINKIGLNYQSGQEKKEDNGVFITIDGSFFWIQGNEVPGQSPNQLKWDASKPENTPSPSGQGNKYLDLRLLALGQHVTIPGFANVTSVQEAIKAMETLPDTEPGEIPPITFDPNSSWLIGMDFGVLKLQEEKPKNQTKALKAASDSGSGYFIDLQIVFNDPNLYALRIALSGEPARIFKGLDFQILYRKISDSVGVYQAEIALPEVMRKIQLGQVNITLPVFAIEIYTNGDFLVDLGFPKNADFSRSFTLQTIIYVPFPIPVMGSAGIYFGKKSSATSTEVPIIDNGTFNPVLVFGVGIQFGVGYDFNAGILAAGFSLTLVTIIEGVIAKFNPYQPEDISTGEQADIAPAYYYSVKGVVGIQGKLYGYVDFKIIKAEVNVLLSVLADLTIAAYTPIQLGLTVKVSVSASIKINLGLFTIKISFSFDMTVRGSYEIKVGSGTAPWRVTGGQESVRLLNNAYRLREHNRVQSQVFLTVLQDLFNDTPQWNNLSAAPVKSELSAYLGFGLSMAGDLAGNNLNEQMAVYSAMLFIQSVPSAKEDSTSAVLKALGDQTDTSFEVIAKQVFRWVIAAFHDGEISAEDVDKLTISQVQLQQIYDYLNDPSNSDPMPVQAINDFLNAQVVMTVSHPSDNSGESDATYFPMVPQLSISLPAYETQKALSYTFGDFNTLSDSYIHDLREYFDELAVRIQQDQETDLLRAQEKVLNNPESMATFIYVDYFLLLARQMVQNAQNALTAFHYPITSNQSPEEIVNWINTHGQFAGGYVYTVSYLFDSNKSHMLTADKAIKVRQATYGTVSQDTFDSISKKAVYYNGFTSSDLATINAASTTILQSGLVIDYPGKDSIVVQAGNSLNSLAQGFGVTLNDLLQNTKILTMEGLLMPSSWLNLPEFIAQTQAGDTLITFSARYGVSISTLAQEPENASIADLFNQDDNSGQLIINDLPQFEVGELLKEIQADNGLQQLSGMASRYYLSGLRLPTDGITPNYQGMWVNDQLKYQESTAGLFALTGQQFPIPILKPGDSYDIGFSIPSGLTWMVFEGDSKALTIPVAQNSTAYAQIDTVRKYALNNYLDLDIDHLGLGDMFNSSYGHYSFSTVNLWQAGSPLLLPYSGVVNDPQTLNIWTLPNDLINLADPAGRAVTPRFKVNIGTVNPATQAVESAPVENYGWGTIVNFTIKKIPVSPDSAASVTTYEISGADGNNALILEQMVTYLNNNDSLIDILALGYSPDQSNGSNPGVQTDPLGNLTIGIAQANLSTFTRPESVFAEFSRKSLQAQGEESNFLNKPTELITLLWQASITRDGGYYLYYFNSENGEGLPEHIFNDKGEAILSLITLYPAPESVTEQNLLQPYMNIFVTGDPVNVNDSTLYAQADPVAHTATFKTGDTLNNVAFQYFTNIGDAVEANSTAPLTNGIDIAVPEGTYEVISAQGESLSSIATKFGTTIEAIKAANPLQKNWPDILPLYTGLRLPPLMIKACADDHSKTLLSISEFYGMDLTSLANYNSEVPSLFENGTQLTMPGGPVTRVATVPAGVVSLEAIRKKPADVPANPNDPDYALLFLQHNFSILTFNLVDNSWFKASAPSLPAGPTDAAANIKNSSATPLDLSDKWTFSQSVPYSKFANQASLQLGALPDISTSPYKGIGYLVQANFVWLDIYGNRILTTLSQPGSGIVNQAPILTGYTDALLGVHQWPSVSSSYLVSAGSTTQIQIPLSFDTTQYNGLLSAKATDQKTVLLTFTEELDSTTATTLTNYKLSPDLKIEGVVLGADNKTVTLTVVEMAEEIYTLAIGNIQNSAKTVTFNGQATYSYPDLAANASSSIIQQAQHDFQIYTQLWYQLTDPNGIELTMDTSLFDQDFKVDNSVFHDLVYNWIASIYLYLQDRSQGKTTVAAPQSMFRLDFDIDPLKVVSDQIFEVVLSLSLTRTGGAIMGDFETTGGIKQVTTLLPPLTNSGSDSSRGLDAFADSFEKAMSVEGQYYLKISTGADREKLGQQKPDGTIWAVRLGINDSDPIAYSVESPGQPYLFAPKPVSNKLESREGVNIYTYTTGSGIDFSNPSYQMDFTEIDLDQWVAVFFSAIDTILTPEFTAPIQLVDKKLGTGYLKKIQDSKESLADIAKLLMVTVFEGEIANAGPVQEALKQALLVKLSNLYATNSGIQFDVKIKADVPAGTAPNLYGNFFQNTILEGAVSGEDHLDQVTLHFNAPLDKDSATDPANYTLTQPLTVKSASLSEDGQSVLLITSGNVTLNVTTVTIGEALLDANNRQIRGEKVAVIATDYASYSKPDQLTITSSKIKLDPATDQSLAFLVSTPEIVRGQDGEVLSKINLNLSYKASDIEHQIGEPVNGFTPSSWLSFVLPAERVPLESQLGGFFVPLFLRAFPQNPSLINQSGRGINSDSRDISKILEWEYTFSYSQSFHFPQDTLYFTVNFNVSDNSNMRLKAIQDAFNQLAEFIIVYPSIEIDLKTILTQIDAKVYYDNSSAAEKLFEDSGVALKSFTEVVQNIVTVASQNGLTMKSDSMAFGSNGVDPYSFEIREGARSLNGQQVHVVSVYGAPPEGVGTPQVFIEPETYEMKVWSNEEDPCDGYICYYYVDRITGKPLLSSIGQSIQEREVCLSQLNILQRQDAITSVYLTRNEDLIEGKKTNPDFVYTTGNLSFSNPSLPTITSDQLIEIANLPENLGTPTVRTLFGQLKTLMDTLLKENTEPTLSFQMTCSYDYSINTALSSFNLPVIMQTMIPVTLATELDPMLQNWSDAIFKWFDEIQPNSFKGKLRFDLVIFSNLTKQPFPLLKMNNLVLSLEYISPSPQTFSIEGLASTGRIL